MGDTLITIVAIVLTAVTMFVLPVVTMADRVDSVSKVDVETITSEFVNEIRSTGKLTQENYEEFITNLTASRKYI